MEELQIQTVCFYCETELSVPFEGDEKAYCKECYKQGKDGKLCVVCGKTEIYGQPFSSCRTGICMKCVKANSLVDNFEAFTKMELEDETRLKKEGLAEVMSEVISFIGSKAE